MKGTTVVITSITSFEQFLINSFLIISIPHALLFFNFLITPYFDPILIDRSANDELNVNFTAKVYI